MHTVGLNFALEHICFHLVEKLLVCNEGLFWLGESCLTYIISELHSYVSLKRRAKKQKKKKNKKKQKKGFLPWSLAFQTQPPQLPLHLSISLSNSLSISLRPSVPLSPTPPSHITPLITPQWEANLRECEGGAHLCVCVCVFVCVCYWGCCTSVSH